MPRLRNTSSALIFVVTILLVSQVPATFATEPRPIPPSLMLPPVTPSGPAHLFEPQPLIPDPAGPMTLERLNRLTISSSWYYALYRTITQSSTNSTAAVDSETSSGSNQSETAANSTSAISHELRIGTTASVSDGVPATNDTLQDAEPVVVALNKNSFTYTVAASNHYTNVSGVIHDYVNAVSSSTFSTFTLPARLPIPNDRRSDLFQDSADPMLAANVYTGGVVPGRVYCSGVLFTPDIRFNLSMIGVWYSDDGGVTWSYPTSVAQQNGGGFLLDKPAITVSQYPSTLGYVYVSYVLVDASNALDNSVFVARSTDGGLHFETPVRVTWDNVAGPVLAVNANDGTVYCA